MDTTVILSKFAEQGILVFGMACVIGYLLWSNKRLQTKIDDKDKEYLSLLREVITLTNSSNAQGENYKQIISTMADSLKTWREEYLRSGGKAQ